jgi:cytoskeleton protein RodZ
MNAVSAIEPPVEAPANTPGAMLRREREQRGLTVQQVSDELHLDTWLVEALEENRFLALGAPVYAKGHLRKYAVLLGLSPELILARYQMIAQPAPPLPPPAEALIAPPSSARRLNWQSMDWRMYGIIGALVFAAAASTWLLSRPRTAAPQVATSAQTAPSQSQQAPATLEAAAASSEAVPPQGAAVTAAVTPAAPPVTKPVQQATLPPQRSASSRAAVPPPPLTQSATPAPVAAAPRIQPPASASAAAVPQPKQAAVPAGQTANVAVPGTASDAAVIPEEVQVSLRLEFSSASWAEVYDGEGRRLLYAVGDPNRARTVSGKPPLKVTLGTAGSVQARVNGRPIAIPRRIGQDSASFTVNANGSIRQPAR